MSSSLHGRLRKAWHIHRRRQKRNAGRPTRLAVTKSRWLWDADSPVVLMIDDLTNAWHNSSGGSTWEHGGDWGGGLDSPHGAVAFLENHLLRDFPEARTTFFVVAGEISAYTNHQPFSHAAPLDASPESSAFFSRLGSDPRFELAYHGYNHGTPGAITDQFLQEWRGFPSREAAIRQTERGLDIFRRATGATPRGGKYGGWDYNELAGDAVSDLGFAWWCRDWMPRDVTGQIASEHYEPQFFGDNLVLALPTTVHGHFWDPRQIEHLLADGQMISIEEHIAPVRPDQQVQTPNIIDDIHELRRLYRHLRSRKVWHANCSDIASYVSARDLSLVHDVTLDGFSIRYRGREQRPLLTLRIDCTAVCDRSHSSITITLPDGSAADRGAFRFSESGFCHLATVPLMDGRYTVRPCAD